eukprot:scaffold692_cov92-Isochrysis_galbana.AAC.2
MAPLGKVLGTATSKRAHRNRNLSYANRSLLARGWSSGRAGTPHPIAAVGYGMGLGMSARGGGCG